jgi:hypothetical protein
MGFRANRMDDPLVTAAYINLFDQIRNDTEKLEDVTAQLCDHIASVYRKNSPERIYFPTIYNIFSEFLEDVSDDVLPNGLTGYQDSLIWQKLLNFQRDAATGIINKLETYSGCILAGQRRPRQDLYRTCGGEVLRAGPRSHRRNALQPPFSKRWTSTSSNCSTRSLLPVHTGTLKLSTI